jgi:hypothetical protein
MSVPATTARRRSRWIIAWLAGAMLAVSLGPTATLAAKPQHLVDTVYSVNTGRTTTPQGTLEFSILFSDVSGPRGNFAYWAPGQVPGAEFARYFGIEGPTVAVDGNRLSGDMAVISDEHEYVGLATYSLEFVAAAPAEVTERTYRSGNVRTVGSVTEQEMLVNGTFTLHDGTTIEISDATGYRTVYDSTSNSPAATVLDGSQTFIDAAWEVDEFRIEFRIIHTELGSEAVAVVYGPEHPEIFGLSRPRIIDDRLVHTFAMVLTDGSVGGSPAGSATVDLAITAVGSRTYFEQGSGYRARVTEEDLAITGTLEIELEDVSFSLSFADASLYAAGTTWHGVQRPVKNRDDGPQG